MADTPNPLSPILARGGRNYALAEPILKLRDGQKPQASKLNDAIRKLYLAKKKEHKAARDEIVSMGQLVSLYCRGQFYLQKNPRTAGYYVRPLAESENRQHSMNLIGTYRHMCVSKIMATNPNVRMSAGDDDPRSVAAAQAARPAIDYWESQFYKARYNWRLALQKLNTGLSITRIRWNPLAPGPTANRQEVGEQENQDEGYGECLDCDFQGSGQEFQQSELSYGDQCPQCQSNTVDVTPPQTQKLSRITQGEQVNMGAPEISLEPLAACYWDLAKDVELSPWGIIEHRIRPGDVKMVVGDAIMPDSEASDNQSLQILRTLQYPGQAFEGRGTSGNDDRMYDKNPTVGEFWVEPEELAGIETEGGKTVDGEELPAGRLSNIFKKPVCFVGFNDMSLNFGIYDERTGAEQLVTGQWLVEADSGVGRGIQDAAATQKRYNVTDGHIYMGSAATATPTVLIDKRLLDDDQSGYLFKPATTIKLNLTQLPAGLTLKDAMHVAQPGTVNPQYITYGQKHLLDMFQLQTFALEFSDSLMTIDPRTATGSQLASSLANSLYGPMAEVLGEERVRIAEILYGLLSKHDPVGRYYPGKDGRRGRTVSSKDLGGKVVFELTADSIVPTTPWSRKQDISSFVQGMGGVEGIIAMKREEPEMFREFAARSNVKVEAEDSDAVSVLCLSRLQQMEEQASAGMDDPQMLVDSLAPPPSVYEPKHKDKREWWSRWLDLEEGQRAPLPLRQAAELMYGLHLNYETQKDSPEAISKGTVAGLGQAAAMAPAALGQQALQNAQPQPTQPDPAQEQQAEAAKQANEHAHQGAIKTMEIDAEDRRTAAELAQADAHKKLEIASGEKTAKLNAASKAQQQKKKAAAK